MPESVPLDECGQRGTRGQSKASSTSGQQKRPYSAAALRKMRERRRRPRAPRPRRSAQRAYAARRARPRPRSRSRRRCRVLQLDTRRLPPRARRARSWPRCARLVFSNIRGNLRVSGQFRGLLTYAPHRRPSRASRIRAEDDDVVSRCAPRVILLACLTSRPLAGRPSGCCRTYARLPMLLLALLLLRRRAMSRPRWPPRSSHGPRSPSRSSHRRSRKTSLPPGSAAAAPAATRRLLGSYRELRSLRVSCSAAAAASSTALLSLGSYSAAPLTSNDQPHPFGGIYEAIKPAAPRKEKKDAFCARVPFSRTAAR